MGRPSGPIDRQPDSVDGLRTLNAGNRGPFTLDGTRTFLVGTERVAVVDPGPSLTNHLAAIERALVGAEEVVVLLTHGHADHAGGALELARRLGAPVLGAGIPDARPLGDGEAVETDAGPLVALETPGHTRDHLCFRWPSAKALFAGDLLLGEGDTTWVAEYPGCVADYLASLDRLDGCDLEVVYPAHGPPLTHPADDVERFRSHRLARIDQARAALRSRPGAGAGELLDAIYGAALPTEMRPAAKASLEAVLDFLRSDD